MNEYTLVVAEEEKPHRIYSQRGSVVVVATINIIMGAESVFNFKENPRPMCFSSSKALLISWRGGGFGKLYVSRRAAKRRNNKTVSKLLLLWQLISRLLIMPPRATDEPTNRLPTQSYPRRV